jgi:DinB superfamily
MTETERLLRQYDVVLRGGAWHGDPIWQILDGVSPECAAHRTLADVHTIWEIVMHMTFWEGVAGKRLAGQRAGLDEALNFPTMPAVNEANWQKTLEEFRASNEEFGKALSKLDAAGLDELTAAGGRSFYDEAHGLIQHNVYHAGQIALLKKDFAGRRASGGL